MNKAVAKDAEGASKATNGSVHDVISPTAISTAYRRVSTDIPYSAEVFKSLEEIFVRSGGSISAKEIIPKEGTFALEARFKLISRVLAESKISQVLELASGFGTRGLSLAQTGMNYVETDLPSVVERKIAVFSSITKKLPPSLHLENGDALSLADLESATKYFSKDKEIAVIHEGLLRYLNFEEKAKVARNVNALLSAFGGVWITPDITLKEGVKTEDKYSVIANTKNATGIDITRNWFDDIAHAKRFFEELGFDVKIHPMLEIEKELVSPLKLGADRETVRKMISPWAVFEMRIKK